MQAGMKMRILAVSDEVVDFIYRHQLKINHSDVDLILGCGDLPLDYLEFIANSLDHGHTSVYRAGYTERISQYKRTEIINVNPYRLIDYTLI